MNDTPNSRPDSKCPLSIIVVGASGDLAHRKIFPALFGLYCQNLLPEEFICLGFARSEMSDEDFRNNLMRNLTCRYVPDERCDEKMDEFLSRCEYMSGQYDDKQAYLAIEQRLDKHWGKQTSNRMFYLAIPPFLFLDVADAVASVGGIGDGTEREGWTRIVIEKPFGHDRESSDELSEGLANVLEETQIYRIDHYLGKTVIQNLMVLRFANLIFEPVWNYRFIENVQIYFMEDMGVGDRGGYFDRYGVIRDVMQNHLLQALALAAMEPPIRFDPDNIRDEKEKLLRGMASIKLEDLVVGQYEETKIGNRVQKGYLQEKGVPEDSITPTFAAAVGFVHNARWDGVPFLLSAGKGLERRATEIHIQFRPVPGNIFYGLRNMGLPCDERFPNNKLIIRIQPDEGMVMKLVNRDPGLFMKLVERDLDLRYESAFAGQELPDAYETLLLDVIRGDKSLFIRSDELAAAWDVFTPILHESEEKDLKPQPYQFGSSGPKAAQELAARYGIAWEGDCD